MEIAWLVQSPVSVKGDVAEAVKNLPADIKKTHWLMIIDDGRKHQKPDEDKWGSGA